MKMLAYAIKQASIANTPKTLEEDRKKVREELSKVKDFPGLTSADGKITIVDMADGKHAGDAIKKGTLIQIQNGKFVPVGEGRAAALKLR
jgi:ABC-type branched-subunit amino acid transport system substrate-binding protein